MQDFKIVVGDEARSIGEWRRILPEEYVFATLVRDNGTVSRKMVRIGADKEASVRSLLKRVLGGSIDFAGESEGLRIYKIGSLVSNVDDWGVPSSYVAAELDDGSWVVSTDANVALAQPIRAGRSIMVAYLTKGDLLGSIKEQVIVRQQNYGDELDPDPNLLPGTLCDDPSPEMKVAVGDRVEMSIRGTYVTPIVAINDYQHLPDPPSDLDGARNPLLYREIYRSFKASEAIITGGPSEVINFSRDQVALSFRFFENYVVRWEDIRKNTGSFEQIGANGDLRLGFDITPDLLPRGYSSICVEAELPTLTMQLGRTFERQPDLQRGPQIADIPSPWPNRIALMEAWEQQNPLREHIVNQAWDFYPDVTIIRPLRAVDDPRLIALQNGAPETKSEKCKSYTSIIKGHEDFVEDIYSCRPENSADTAACLEPYNYHPWGPPPFEVSFEDRMRWACFEFNQVNSAQLRSCGTALSSVPDACLAYR